MLQTNKPYQVVDFADPAIDLSRSDWDGYLRTRDVTKLAFKEGQKPTIFWCKPIATMDAMRLKRSTAHDGEIEAACFRHAVTRVENLEQPDDCVKPEAEATNTGPLWSEDEINRRFGADVLADVGEVIRVTTFLSRWPQGYVLPHSRLQDLLTIQDLAAEQVQNTSSESPDSSTQAPEAQASDDSDDEPGSARATA